MFGKTILAGSALFAFGSLAQAAPVDLIPANDPSAMVKALQGRGYKAALSKMDGGTPIITTEMGGMPMVVTFGDCTKGTACKYAVFVTTFTDIVRPPARWVNKHNTMYDMIKIFTNDDGSTSLISTILMGNQGLSPAALDYFLEQWPLSVSEIAQSAIDEKLVTGDTTAK